MSPKDQRPGERFLRSQAEVPDHCDLKSFYVEPDKLLAWWCVSAGKWAAVAYCLKYTSGVQEADSEASAKEKTVVKLNEELGL